MEEIYPALHMEIRSSTISLLEEPPIPGEDDTTRVEHIAVFNPTLNEAVQAYTPRSAIVDCRFWSSGPQDFTTVRVWKGGRLIGNYFLGSGESNAMAVRQETIEVAWNFFAAMFISFTLDNATAPETAALFFRNNVVAGSVRCSSV